MELSPMHLHDAPTHSVLKQVADFNFDNPTIEPARSGMTKPSPLPLATIMRRNLATLFCGPDPAARLHAFDELWHPNAVIYQGKNAGAGRAAVLEIAARFQLHMDGLTCSQASSVLTINDLHMLRWVAHREGSPVATGCQIGLLVRDRIHSFYMIED